jgi:hypothetical protein
MFWAMISDDTEIPPVSGSLLLGRAVCPYLFCAKLTWVSLEKATGESQSWRSSVT